MKNVLFLLFLFISGVLLAQSPKLVVKYDFQDNLTDSKANSTLYTFGTENDGYNHNNATSGFNADANGSNWYWTSTLTRGGGLWIDIDENISENYSIGIRFSYENTEVGYRKIIDFKNLSSDYKYYY